VKGNKFLDTHDKRNVTHGFYSRCCSRINHHHQTHEGGWIIGKTNEKHHKLIVPIPCMEFIRVDVFFFDAHLMISQSQINL